MNIHRSTLAHVGVGLSAVALAVFAAFALDSSALQATANSRGGFGGGPPGIQTGRGQGQGQGQGQAPGQGQGQGPNSFGPPTNATNPTSPTATNRTTR